MLEARVPKENLCGHATCIKQLMKQMTMLSPCGTPSIFPVFALVTIHSASVAEKIEKVKVC